MGRNWRVLIAIVCAALFVDAPMLVISFVGDDALRANIDGWLAVHHATLLDAFRSELIREDLMTGRFHPAFVGWTLLEMHLIHRPFPLKLAQLLAVGLNVATLAFVVHELTGSAKRALAAAACSVLMLQIRAVYDATNGDTLHLQLTLESGLLTIGLFAYARRNEGSIRWISYGASIVFYATAVALYELMLPLLLPLLLLTASGDRGRTARRFAMSLPFVAVAAADVATLIVVRRMFPPTAGSFYAASFGTSYAYAAASQVFSTLPFVYEFVDPQNIFRSSGTYWALAALAMLASVGGAVAWLSARRPAVDAVNTRDRINFVSLATGFVLTLSGTIAAASPIYQQMIRPGLPYAPVYFQGFGLALIAFASFPRRTAAPSRQSRLARVAYGLSLLVLFIANVIVARALIPSGYARSTIVDGLTRDAADDVPAGALVFLDQSYYWVNGNSYFGLGNARRGPLLWDSVYFYRLWSGRTWRTRPLSAEKLSEGEKAFEIRSVANDADHGILIVQRVRGRGISTPPTLQNARIYQRGLSDSAPPAPRTASAFASDDFKQVSSGPGWRLSEFRPHCDALANDALVANAPTAARLIYERGFGVVESDGKREWRWAEATAGLTFVNDTDRRIVSNFRAAIETVGRSRGNVTIILPGGEQRVAINAQPRIIKILVSIAPRSHDEVLLRANSPNVALPGDARDLRYRIVDAITEDQFGCGAADASSSSH